jgi:hypothetical protein
MTETRKRRELHFDSIDEAMADAQRLASGEVETSGYYSFGQILEHLARAMDTVTGELTPEPVGLPLRIAARLARPYVLSHPLRSGFKLPAKSQSLLWPTTEVDVATGLESWKQAIERFEQVEPLRPHPVLGKLNRQQHTQMQCRHSELHLSFVHPVSGS